MRTALVVFPLILLMWAGVLYHKISSVSKSVLDSVQGPFPGAVPNHDAPSSTDNLGKGDEWKKEISLDGSPQGLAWNGEEFLIGNRVTPWGVLRLGLDGRQRKTEVKEPAYNQKIQLPVLTWNGSNYVGYVDGAWFQKNNTNLFTVHDPATLAVVKTYPAPNLIGGLAWDGTSYWAATRRNTRDSAEPAFIYQLDAEFNVLKQFQPPAFGCQGLVWAGSSLWWVDVFTDEIFLLRPSGETMEKVHTYRTGLDYLSGIAFDGQNIWVSEYKENKLVRLPTRLVRAFLRGDFRVRHHELVDVCKTLIDFAGGNQGPLDELLAKTGNGTVRPEMVHEAAEAMISLDAREPLIQGMNLALSRNEYSANHAVIRQELERLTAPPSTPTPETTAEPALSPASGTSVGASPPAQKPSSY